MEAYPNPCDTCKLANHCLGRCAAFRKWFNWQWLRIRSQIRGRTPPAKASETSWRYESPTVIRHYLQRSPCETCARRSICDDDAMCRSYKDWAAVKWEIAAGRMRRMADKGGGNLKK